MVSINEFYRKYKKEHLKEANVWLPTKIISYLGIPLNMLILRTNITPNQITVAWTIIGLISCLFFIPGTYLYSIIGALLLNVTLLMDTIDGTIARYKKISPDNGDYLESIGHSLIDGFLMTCISFGVYNRYGNPLVFFLGFLGCISALILQLLFKEKIHLFVRNKIFLKFRNKPKPTDKEDIIRKIYKPILSIYRPDFFFFILFILALINKVYIFILFYGITYPILILGLYIHETKRGYSWVYGLFIRKRVLK